MGVLEVISKEPLSLAQLNESLVALEKRDGELNFRAKRVKEYLEQVKPLSVKEAKALEQKLNGLDISRLKQQHVAKLVDLRPKDMDGLKAMFAGEHVTLKPEELEKILSALNG